MSTHKGLTIKYINDQAGLGNFVLVKQGWLTKKGAKVKNWKRRWCILVEDKTNDTAELYYYEKQDVPTKAPAGCVELSAEHSAATCSVPGKLNCFQIVTAERTWVMFADTQKESQSWVKLLTSTIKALPRAGEKKRCEKCNEADAAAKIAVRGQLTSLCKACAKDSLAVTAVQDKDDVVVTCEECKFRFKSQAMLDRHTRDWHTCNECNKVGRTDAVASGDGFVRMCFDCAMNANPDGAAADASDNSDDASDDAAPAPEKAKKSKKKKKKSKKDKKQEEENDNDDDDDDDDDEDES